MVKIYFDACCLNRPFDDQSQDRIRLETEAILLILSHVEQGDLEWIGSEVLDYEIRRIPDLDKKDKISNYLRHINKKVSFDEEEEERAEVLKKLGFGSYDALHLACAESGKADIFLTTDDKLLKIADRNLSKINMKVKNPLIWFKEELDK